MRRAIPVLAFLAFWACAPAAAQTYTIVQKVSSSGTTSVSSKAVAFTSNIASGNMLFTCFNWGNSAGTPTVSDTLTNTWTEFLSVVRGVSGLNDLSCFWAKAASSGADTVTESESGGGNHTLRVEIKEVSASTGWLASPVDQHNSASNATATCCTTGNPGNITPSVTSTFFVSAMQTGTSGVTNITVTNCTEEFGSGTAGTGWLSDGRADGATISGASTSSQTCTYSWTTAAAWSALLGNFKATAAGGGSSAPQLPLTGVGKFLLSKLFLPTAQPGRAPRRAVGVEIIFANEPETAKEKRR